MSDIKKTDAYSQLISDIDQQHRMIVACLWKNPSLYEDIDLTYKDFENFDNQWATVFDIGLQLIKQEHKKVISESDVSNYLKKHKKCKKVWDNIDPDNPYERIFYVIQDIPSPNIDSYISKRKDLIIIKQLADKGMIATEEDLIKYMSKTSEQIYDEYEAWLNSIFTSNEMDVKHHNLYDNIYENIQSWNEGSVMGMELFNLPGFSKYIGGIPLGSVTLLGGVSNSGKSSLLRNSILPSLFATPEQIKQNKKKLQENENANTLIPNKTVIFLNEEDIGKWQREVLIWIMVHKQEETFLDKNIFKFKNFYDNIANKQKIDRAVELMHELIPEKQILFVPLPKFSTNYVIKLIKKYAALQYETFIIDTFKMDNIDNSKIDSNTRLQLVQNMTHLYNIAKKDGGKNVRIICTVQLSKSYTLQRYLSQESLAESKNMIDVCSTGIFMRRVWDDEKVGGNNALPVFKYDDGKAFPTCPLQSNKNYILLFPAKTREGGVEHQCVAEVDWARNTIKEIGFTQIAPSM